MKRLLTYFDVNKRSHEFVIQKAASSCGNLGMSECGLSKILYWDGKSESFGVYISKIDAYMPSLLVWGDVLDPHLMKNCHTRLEFAVLDVTRAR